MSEQKLFHITVATTPEDFEESGLRQEFRLLKAALLYADKVKFCSPSSSMLNTLMSLGTLKSEEFLQFYAIQTGKPEIVEAIQAYKILRKKRKSNLYRQHLGAYTQLEKVLRQYEVDSRRFFEGLADKAGIDELTLAVESQLVELHPFSFTNDDDLFVKEYFDVIKDAVTSGQTYPLFDDLTGDLIRSAIKEGKINLSDELIHRAKHIGLSSDLFQRLPLFDNAPIDEVIDIRKELDKPLVGFRSAVMRFSREVENAPWGEDFPLEAERVFREHVEPSILEIEDAVKSNKLLFALLPDLATKEIAASSILGIALASASQLPEMAVIGLVGGLSATVLQNIREWREKSQSIQSNQLYFYYKAGKMLTS